LAELPERPHAHVDQPSTTIVPFSTEQALDQLVMAIVSRTRATPNQELAIRQVLLRVVEGGALRDARDAIVDAMVEIREILDPEQRELLTLPSSR
jgi:hypothetical protein